MPPKVQACRVFSVKPFSVFSDILESYGAFENLSPNDFPPTEERAGPEGAEEEDPRVISSTYSTSVQTHGVGSRNENDGEEDDEDEGEEQCKFS